MTDAGKRRTPARRDLVVAAAGAMVATGGVLALWPLIAQLGPAADSVSGDGVDVDLAPIRPGGSITVAWNGLPVVVRHRTPAEIESARSVAVRDLRDRLARNAALPETAPATDENRTLAGHAGWLVVVGRCPHLGCRLIEPPEAASGGGIGFVCPCDAARFDHAGRVVAGPAPTNLLVPPFRLVQRDRIRIGSG